MFYNFSTIVNDQSFNISCNDGRCNWVYDGSEVNLPVLVRSIAIGKEHIFAVCVEEVGLCSTPENIRIYDLKGNYLWNFGEIIRTVTTAEEYFSYVEAHTKESLAYPPWSSRLESVNLKENHEYLSAYDGGCQWLFDVTDKKCIQRVFTH